MTTNPEMLYTAKIEQTWDYPKRMKYIAEIDSFIAKDYDSLSYYRNFQYNDLQPGIFFMLYTF